MNKTKIPYGGLSWSCVTGCSGVDETGKELPCKERCWARGIAHRFDRDFTPRFHPERLSEPLRRKKPAFILPAFTGDIFDAAIKDEEIAAIFGVMAAAPWHTFCVLTKQAQRLERWFAWLDSARPAWLHGSMPCDWRVHFVADTAATLSGFTGACGPLPEVWPLPNAWIGTSVMTQKDADERIPHLLRCPAAVRWVSYEPALELVDFRRIKPWHPDHGSDGADALCGGSWGNAHVKALAGGGPGYCNHSNAPRLNWIAMAAESGPHARPFDLAWARRTRDDCAEGRVAFMLKNQMGFPPLDGVVHREMPGMAA